MLRFIACLALLLGVAAPFTAQANVQGQSVNCAADSVLAYVCGAERPEDLLALPDTQWLITSGFAKGAGLKLVDTRTRALTQWYSGSPDQLAHDRTAFPDCKVPPDAALFNARGLSLRMLKSGLYRLLVVNHGGREAVEAFDVSAAAGQAPSLRWRGCMPMPAGHVANSVAQFSDGTVLVTVLTRPGTTIGDFMLGQNTGAVWQRGPGDRAFALLPGTELPGNNGIEVDPDQRRFYVVAFGWHAVVVFDRRDTAQPLARIEAPDFMPDNIHWTGGRLLLAGMRLDEPACGGLRKVTNGQADAMACHRGWVVGELDLATRRIATFAYGQPQLHFNGLSAAALVGQDLWLGSYQVDRIGVIWLQVVPSLRAMTHQHGLPKSRTHSAAKQIDH